MKIVHLTSVHPVHDVRVFYKECLSLRQSGYEVILIVQHEADSIIDDVKIAAVPKTPSRFTRMTKLLWQIYRRALMEKGDLYHFHDPELIVVGLLLRLHGKKVVYDIHEDVPNDILLKHWIPSVIRQLISKFFRVFENSAAKYFDGLITVTSHIANRFNHPLVAEVRNYPNLAEFKKNTDHTAGLCYAGLITPERGLFEMIHIANKIKLPLKLAGNFNCDALKAKVVANNSIQYLGYLKRGELSNFYNQSLVGLSLLHSGPTFTHALPIKLFEYMAAGIPVIASDFPLWQQIIERHGCGYCIDPKNIDLICEKIIYLQNHPDIAQEMGRRGRQAVEQFYNWQSEFDKLTSLYQKILRTT